MAYTAAVITVSDLGSRGQRVDTSGPAICAMLEKAGFTVTYTAIVPDEIPQIQTELTTAADGRHINLIITTGGTGLSPRDVTPKPPWPSWTAKFGPFRWPCGWRALKSPPAPCFPEP